MPDLNYLAFVFSGVCSKMCLYYRSMFILMLCAETLEGVLEDQARQSR